MVVVLLVLVEQSSMSVILFTSEKQMVNSMKLLQLQQVVTI